MFDSPERAMAILPGAHWTKTTWARHLCLPGRTIITYPVRWDNELAGEEKVSIIERELVVEGPLRAPDKEHGESIVDAVR